MQKYAKIAEDGLSIDSISFNPDRVMVPAKPAVKDSEGNIIEPAVEAHWGELESSWIPVDDSIYAGFIKQGSAWVPPATAPRTTDEILGDYKYSFDMHLDRVAQSKQYDNRFTITTYCTSGIPVWKAEAEQFIEWRDAAMMKMFEILAEVQAGTIEQPSIEEFIELLPATPWPVE